MDASKAPSGQVSSLAKVFWEGFMLEHWTRPGFQPSLSCLYDVQLNPQPEEDAEGLVVCFGDSLTRGGHDPMSAERIVRLGAEREDAYPELLAALLRRSGRRFGVVNAGVWGEKSSSMIQRLPQVLAALREERKAPIRAVLLLAGANELMDSVDKILTNLGTLCGIACDDAGEATAPPCVIILTIPPSPRRSLEGRWTAKKVNEGLREACSIRDVASLFLVDLEEHVDGALTFDGLHFTAAGYAVFAQHVYAAIQESLFGESIACNGCCRKLAL
eukprot:TRINITY_DN59089_c0_g1_i1.p1 TRINITY_DN59089_c0_g1~~TRINITY_DN59089_c0_g1_i1.p1  ORF type:complete len:284 (+),score=35.18 TRINITY_DN59089_c0_g1_i1:33-854(+)